MDEACGSDATADQWSDTDEEALANLDYPGKHTLAESTIALEFDRLSEETPLQKYRPSYNTVSDFAKQHWCEQQLLYTLSPEMYLMRALPGETVSIEDSKEVKKAKGTGSDIHLARELEVQEPVAVVVETKEDKWAVKFLNLLMSISSFHCGESIAREIPVFGMPFDCGIFVYGVIDELKYYPNLHTLEISELKTRMHMSPPKPAQQRKDKFQVNLYSLLFNDLIRGKVTKDMVGSHLKLDLHKPLTEGVLGQIGKDERNSYSGHYCLSNLLETILLQIQSLTCISKSWIEYIHQESKNLISMVDVEHDEDSLQLEFFNMVLWWQGKRATTGVDIEDCWKCQYCPYCSLCEWREIMAKKSSKTSKSVDKSAVS